ncbi:MAG TPA: beta-propeller domain-containing protein [Longimicrobium sp.]
MKKITVLATLAWFAAAGCAESAGRTGLTAAPEPQTLPAFASEAELGAYLRRLAKEQQRLRTESHTVGAAASAAEVAPVAVEQSSVAADASSRAEGESVTSVQHAGVDEGGIVKVHGDYLVMLRRGRLFTVAIGGNALQPVSAVDAFGPDIDPSASWYDELLVSGDAVVVIGFSYERGGTEVGLFRIFPDGRLQHRSTYHLTSNDYYSSRNYASRLIEGKLVFYTPLYLGLNEADPFADFPSMRRWTPGAEPGQFQRILPATRVYQPGRALNAQSGVALHTVTVCDLRSEEMGCEGTAVLGPPGRVFYVSPGAVYVWVSDWVRREGEKGAESMLYRIPLDGAGPSALAVRGSPVDQFSFLESADRHLNVLVRSGADGDGMWHGETTGGSTSLLRVSLDSFGDGRGTARQESYRALPTPEGHTFQNRFVGDYLLYGTGSGWGPPEQRAHATLYAVPWLEGGASALALPHGVDRIEAMGGDAVIVGTDGQNLHFSAVKLGARPELAQRYVSANASQGELRSHGFFYKPDGRESGILGLPIRGEGAPGYAHLYQGSASILFLRNRPSRFEALGELAARADGSADDGCRASCVDWYGNARPLFLRGRIFALLGYEIVEGRLDGGTIREARRISYAPRAVVAEGR